MATTNTNTNLSSSSSSNAKSSSDLSKLEKSNMDLLRYGKVDIFQELQEIATWSITQTGIFCSNSNFLDRESLISADKLAKAKETG